LFKLSNLDIKTKNTKTQILRTITYHESRRLRRGGGLKLCNCFIEITGRKLFHLDFLKNCIGKGIVEKKVGLKETLQLQMNEKVL